MTEDQSRNRKDHGPGNIAMPRRLALNLAKLEGSKGSMKGKFKRAGWDDTFLTQRLAAFGATQMRSPRTGRVLLAGLLEGGEFSLYPR